MRKAAPIRMRPVLMTAISMIFGVVPAAFGFGPGLGDARADGGRAGAGMFSSTLLTLLVVPVFYLMLDDLGREGARASGAAGATHGRARADAAAERSRVAQRVRCRGCSARSAPGAERPAALPPQGAARSPRRTRAVRDARRARAVRRSSQPRGRRRARRRLARSLLSRTHLRPTEAPWRISRTSSRRSPSSALAWAYASPASGSRGGRPWTSSSGRASLVTLALTVYLVYALLRPERF